MGAGGDTVKAYLAYPERGDPAPAMIVIHEIFGMSDWIKSVTEDPHATADYLGTLKAVRAGAIGVIGFCFGGGQSFRYSTNNSGLKAAVVCYGPAPDRATLGRIAAPVFGVYAENDARITTAVSGVDSAIKAAGKPYQSAIYPGTGHGFLRTRDVAAQADKAWSDIFTFLGAKLGK